MKCKHKCLEMTIDPVCATCREKCRRCDRTKPTCRRCAVKGLECKGYPEKFRFHSVNSTSKRTNRKRESASLMNHVIQFHDEHPKETSISWETWEEESREKYNLEVEQQTLAVQAASPGVLLPWDADIARDSTPAYSNPSSSPHQSDTSELDHLLILDRTQSLLSYYDKVICPHQIMLSDANTDNPYRSFVLPLAYEQLGVLYAVLGLATCHKAFTAGELELRELADEYRLRCINCLINTIQKGISPLSHESERDGIFVTIQLLLLYDICESGVSTHGAHITGAMSVCNQLRLSDTLTAKDERAVFFLGNIAWLDVIRSFSNPKRLCFSSDLRQTIVALSTSRFEQVNGCPRELFLVIGNALECAKSHNLDDIDLVRYKALLNGKRLSLDSWQLLDSNLPDHESNWGAVYESFRHAFLIYISRLISPEQPPESSYIRESVEAVLDSVSEIPPNLIELAIFPLFIAGTDALLSHTRHYILLRLDTIKSRAGFSNDLPKMILQKVWEARGNQQKRDTRNILWTSFTDTTARGSQDDYLII